MDIGPWAPAIEECAQADREKSTKDPWNGPSSIHCGGSPPRQTRYWHVIFNIPVTDYIILQRIWSWFQQNNSRWPIFKYSYEILQVIISRSAKTNNSETLVYPFKESWPSFCLSFCFYRGRCLPSHEWRLCPGVWKQTGIYPLLLSVKLHPISWWKKLFTFKRLEWEGRWFL